MKSPLFFWQALSFFNRLLLPRMSQRATLIGLKKWEQAIVGWRMWVTYRLLDAQNNLERQA
ncbi:MAG: SsrA-binding protein [Bacteroidetes bacterium]|jgi:hypothetical protein|nr:SsrA-binding protein [Bacteroidota bacterium]